MGCGLALSLALSAHINTSYDNSFHPNIQMDCDEFMFGAYYNSISDVSLYVGKNNQITDDISIDTGIVSGYRDSVLPFIRVNYKNFFIAPSDDGGAVIGIEIPIGGNKNG